MLPVAISSGPERMNCQMNRNGSNRPRRVPAKATLKYSSVPPDEGMADASSAQTMPSQMASTAPRTHPSIACGPPIEARISGMVRNGPTPTMYDMFMAVACHKPKPRCMAWLGVGRHVWQSSGDTAQKSKWNTHRLSET